MSSTMPHACRDNRLVVSPLWMMSSTLGTLILPNIGLRLPLSDHDRVM
jgi:hypothetical protein